MIDLADLQTLLAAMQQQQAQPLYIYVHPARVRLIRAVLRNAARRHGQGRPRPAGVLQVGTRRYRLRGPHA